MSLGFIKYFIIIAIIVGAAFVSQQAFSGTFSRNIATTISGKIGKYLSDASSWTTSALIPQISEKVQSGGEAVFNGLNQEKEKISESAVKDLKNYFSGIADSILHPGENNCQTPAN